MEVSHNTIQRNLKENFDNIRNHKEAMKLRTQKYIPTNKGTIEKPITGDIRREYELGLAGGGLRMWFPCKRCKIERWAEINSQHNILHQYCKDCCRKNKTVTEDDPHWYGIKHESEGYYRIRIRKGDFFVAMCDKSGYVLEHRLVMAKHLGRCLQKWEIVHHKNGIRNDNKIENLELTTNAMHIKDHNQGYRDGYIKGYRDGKNKRILELEVKNKELLMQLKLDK